MRRRRRQFYIRSLSLERLANAEEEASLDDRIREWRSRPEVESIAAEDEALWVKAGLRVSKTWLGRWRPGPVDGTLSGSDLIRAMWQNRTSEEKKSQYDSHYRTQWQKVFQWFENLNLSLRQLKTAYPDIPYWDRWYRPVKLAPSKRKAPPIPDEIMAIIQLDKLMVDQGEE